MKTLTPKQAFRQIEKLEAQCKALHKQIAEVAKRVPRQWRVGDRIRLRTDLGRIKYLQVTDVSTRISYSEKTILEALWGRTITKGGTPLSRVRRLSRAESDIANRIDIKAGK